MKTKLFIIAITAFLFLMFSVSAHALTKQWNYDLGTDTVDLDYYIDQIAADGKGGCAVVWYKYDSSSGIETVYVTRFDKKGQKVWEKSYPERDAEIAYCTKKMIIFAVFNGSGNEIVVSIDKKGIESNAENPTADIDGKFNSETIPLGDKKGFFAERKETSLLGKCSLVRYTYK